MYAANKAEVLELLNNFHKAQRNRQETLLPTNKTYCQTKM